MLTSAFSCYGHRMAAANKPTIAHTAGRVAAQEGREAAEALVRRSALRWWLVALLGSSVAIALTHLEGLDGRVLAGGGGGLLLVVLLALPRLKRPALAARLALLLGTLALGALGGAGELIGSGFGLTFGASWGLGEALGVVLTLASRRPLVPMSVVVPAMVSSALVYAAPALASPLGAGAGAAAAVVLLALARVGEHAAPYRHAADQLDAAAATRLLEPGRALWLSLSPDVLPDRLEGASS
jgi:hypothetical protein